jgi:hypothetical protein
MQPACQKHFFREMKELPFSAASARRAKGANGPAKFSRRPAPASIR